MLNYENRYPLIKDCRGGKGGRDSNFFKLIFSLISSGEEFFESPPKRDVVSLKTFSKKANYLKTNPVENKLKHIFCWIRKFTFKDFWLKLFWRKKYIFLG